MQVSDVLRLRLRQQHLTHSTYTDPALVVEWMGAMQAQDYAMVKWALGLRMRPGPEGIPNTDAVLERTLDDGAILRTHVLRPTWHIVHPTDLRWMLELTGPSVKKSQASYARKLELEPTVLSKSHTLICNELAHQRYCTRQELKSVLTRHGIETDVQRLAYLIMWAELDGLICSGPRRGKQFTYALLSERVPETAPMHREEARALLAEKYFRSHGPAKLKDFAWWSGLSMRDVQQATQSIQHKLSQTVVNGETFWHTVDLPTAETTPLYDTFLLSIYDEYTIAYKDRSLLSDADGAKRLYSLGNDLTAVMVRHGRVVGTWKRNVTKSRVEVQLRPFKPLSSDDRGQFSEAAERLGRFLELSSVLTVDAPLDGP
ncbi:MAG: winged helix DNA-binding domain-containing protein [Anaerolineae bacterium]